MPECGNCCFVTTGTECPECGEISKPNLSLQYHAIQQKLYGSTGVGHYFEGLGRTVYGKNHLDKIMQKEGLRQIDTGEKLSNRKAVEREKRSEKFVKLLAKKFSKTELPAVESEK